MRLITVFLALLGLAQAQTLTLYTSEVLPNVNPMIELFKRANPGTDVRVFRSGTGEVVARFRAELEAGNPQADLLWIADETFFRELSGRNLLRRVPITTSGYPVKYAYEAGRYYEVRLLYNVMAINTRKLGSTPKPQFWRDLTKAPYRNLVAMPNPSFSGAALSTLGTFSSRFGFGVFEQLRTNGMKVEQSNPVLLQKLASGEYGVAIMVDYSVREEIRKGAPLEVLYPRDGAILVPTPVGVLSSTKQPALAERFLRFLLSPEAQRLFSQQGYLPIMPGIPLPEGVSREVLAVPSAADFIQRERVSLIERFNNTFGLR